MAGGGPPTEQQLVAAGWGYVAIDPASIQADNVAGITAASSAPSPKASPASPTIGGAPCLGMGAARSRPSRNPLPAVDPKWFDQKGSYMATDAAEPVCDLLGAAALGVSDNYNTAETPPVNQGPLDGKTAWRQNDGGHTDAPNVKHSIEWATQMDEYLARLQCAHALRIN
jgi:hypothetical protein